MLAKTPPGTKIKTLTITPELAEKWLGKNRKNRNISRATVDAYARDMKAGKWRLTYDPIRFDQEGLLIDGQHRLLACLQAGKPFDSLVVEGVAGEANDVIDSGYKRYPATVLAANGYTYATVIAAAAVNLLQLKSTGDGVFRGSSKGRRTVSEIMGVLAKHPRLADSAEFIYNKHSGRFVFGPPPALAVMMHYIIAHILKEPEKAEAFIGVFQTGQPAYKGDPAQVWREKIIRSRAAGTPMERNMQFRGIMHAWNLFAKRTKSDGAFKVPEEVSIDGLDVKKL